MTVNGNFFSTVPLFKLGGDLDLLPATIMWVFYLYTHPIRFLSHARDIEFSEIVRLPAQKMINLCVRTYTTHRTDSKAIKLRVSFIFKKR